MSIDKFIVSISGILGIAFTYWFFLMKKGRLRFIRKRGGVIERS